MSSHVVTCTIIAILQHVYFIGYVCIEFILFNFVHSRQCHEYNSASNVVQKSYIIYLCSTCCLHMFKFCAVQMVLSSRNITQISFQLYSISTVTGIRNQRATPIMQDRYTMQARPGHIPPQYAYPTIIKADLRTLTSSVRHALRFAYIEAILSENTPVFLLEFIKKQQDV